MSKPIIDFTPYINERTRDFTGREWVFTEIDRWLANPDAPSFLIIIGEPGVGKSAIAARLTQVRDLAAYHVF
jgi:MoxR-like ATPase